MNTAEFGFHAEPITRDETCPTHGTYVAKCRFRDVWSGCPACKSERDAKRAADEAAELKRQEAAKWQRRLGFAGIPERFQDRHLSRYVAGNAGQSAALEFANDYAENFAGIMKTGRSAVLVGKPGTGKTHLAVGIGLSIMERGHTALFTTAMRALRRVKETWSKAAEETERQAIEALVFPDLLILDEVGVQFGSDTEKLILFDVLNERYEQRKPTLLLSNLTVPEVRDYLGERIFDRLREDGGRIVVFDWQSHRGADGKATSAGPDA